jgi:uncharacterized MAPEG superfamily protein
MTFVVTVIFIAGALPLLFVLVSGFPSKTTHARWGKDYDNKNVRASLERLEGWRRRAHYAQQNGYEAFPPFAAGMMLAKWSNVAQAVLVPLGVAFLVFRVLHGSAYIVDSGFFRSAFWWCGLACTVGLFGSALAASL